MRHIFVAFAVVWSSALFAQEQPVVNFDKLTPKQQQEIMNSVDQKMKENGFQTNTQQATSEPVVVEKTKSVLSYVAESGEAIGKGIGAIVRELGVVVSEFLNSPVGMLAVGLLVWQVVGADLVQLITGLMVLILGNVFLLPAAYRWMADEVKSMNYTHVQMFTGKQTERIKIVHRIRDSERLGAFICVCAVVNFAGFIALVAL